MSCMKEDVGLYGVQRESGELGAREASATS